MRLRPKRMIGLLVLLAVCGAASVWFWPPPEAATAPAESALDLAMPLYHHRALATRRVCAATESIDRALRELRAEEVEGFGLLLSIRQRRGQAVGAAKRDPLFEALRRASFVPVADLPREEMVLGMAGPLWTLHGPRGAEAGEIRRSLRAVEGDPRKFAALEFPHAAKAAWGMRVSIQLGDPCPMVSSEIRVYCPPEEGRRPVARLWRIGTPLRAYLQRNLLAAVARRAGER